MPQPGNATKTRRKGKVALGSNLPATPGTPVSTVAAALSALDSGEIAVTRISRLYRTPCFPPGAGPDFVNAAAEIETALDAPALLAGLHAIEAAFGRARAGRWGPRTLDIDLLDLGGMVLPDPATQAEWRNLPPDRQNEIAPDQLILPHPRLQDRAFVLVPLAEIDPGWLHPCLGLTASELLDRLPAEDKAAIRPISPAGATSSSLVKSFQKD